MLRHPPIPTRTDTLFPYPTLFRSSHFAKARTAAGVSCRFHDLRHTSVALAIAAGAHPKAIQSRMGHSSINVTLDRYGHLFPELDEAIALAFRSEEHTSELQSLMRISYAVFCLKKKKNTPN